jgi:nitrogen fixation NifU-like protein
VSTDLHHLYQRAILDHSREPRNFRVIAGGRRGERDNPLCGDRVTVYVQIEGEAMPDVAFQGTGCAIVKASASLMTESLKGRTLAEALALADRLQRMLAAPPGTPLDGNLGALDALAGVRAFPLRVRCAALAWEAFRAACYDPPTRR